MYKGYLDSKIGVIEIIANDKYLTNINLVKEFGDETSNSIVSLVKEQLELYFSHKLVNFDVPIEFNDTFRSKVLRTLYETKIGEKLSYKQLGDRCDTKAYRAVGSANATNPIPIIIPCHRVIKHSGEIGNYFYGTKIKEQLLLHEMEKLFEKNCTSTFKYSDEEVDKLKNHAVLSKMFDVMPIQTTLTKFNSNFECIISQILYQQVTFSTARKQELYLYELCNYKLTRESLNNVSDKALIKIGLNGPRLKYIRNVCNADIDYEALTNLSDEEVYETLIQIKGIGSWTIEVFQLFGLARSNIISYKDLIIIKGLKVLYNKDSIDLKEFESIVSDFKGFESIASINIWKYIEQGYYLKN